MRILKNGGSGKVNFLHMELCFEFVLKTVDNIDSFVIAEQHLHSNKAFSAPPTTLPARGLWVHKKLGGETAGTGDPTDTRHFPDRMTSHSVYIVGRRRRTGGCSE